MEDLEEILTQVEEERCMERQTPWTWRDVVEGIWKGAVFIAIVFIVMILLAKAALWILNYITQFL